MEASAPSVGQELSLWALKPWWCQPWSILLTGIVAIAGSWFLLGRLWITIPGAALVLLWWWLFLVIVPRAYRAEARSGVPPERP
jgi:membrane protein YdbS with pleckstrin-like domain